MSTADTTKMRIMSTLDTLSPEHLGDVKQFIDFLRFQARQRKPPCRVVKLGGLWSGYSFTEEEFETARQEAWSSLGKGFDE